MNNLGENIAVLRKKKGLTQEALATSIGVSTQTISKWENNTNKPDILLLPIIADIFGVDIDNLFGRTTDISLNPNKALDKCCDDLLKNLCSCMYHFDLEEYFEDALRKYKKSLKNDATQRTGIIHKDGVVYYRDKIGGLLLKKPEGAWHDLLKENNSKINILELISDVDFCTALKEIIKTKKTIFTISSLSKSCEIKDLKTLEDKFSRSKLFSVKTVDIDNKKITIYELIQGQKLFLLFAVLTYAAEFDEYENIYTGYYCDGGYYFA